MPKKKSKKKGVLHNKVSPVIVVSMIILVAGLVFSVYASQNPQYLGSQAYKSKGECSCRFGAKNGEKGVADCIYTDVDKKGQKYTIQKYNGCASGASDGSGTDEGSKSKSKYFGIKGKVTCEGTPAEGVKVNLYRGKNITTSDKKVATTDKNGYFWIKTGYESDGNSYRVQAVNGTPNTSKCAKNGDSYVNCRLSGRTSGYSTGYDFKLNTGCDIDRGDGGISGSGGEAQMARVSFSAAKNNSKQSVFAKVDVTAPNNKKVKKVEFKYKKKGGSWKDMGSITGNKSSYAREIMWKDLADGGNAEYLFTANVFYEGGQCSGNPEGKYSDTSYFKKCDGSGFKWVNISKLVPTAAP